jgi:hypothetical protein
VGISATSISFTFNNVATGGSIFLPIQYYLSNITGGLNSISDSVGNNYTLITGIGSQSTGYFAEMWYCDNVNGGSPITITININPNQINVLTVEPVEILNLTTPSFQFPITPNPSPESTFAINNPNAVVGSYCLSSVCAINGGSYSITAIPPTNILSHAETPSESLLGALAQVVSPSAGYAGTLELSDNHPSTYWAAVNIILNPFAPLNAIMSLKFIHP